MINVLIRSIKWGHLGNLDPNSTNTSFSTTPMGSSGTLVLLKSSKLPKR